MPSDTEIRNQIAQRNLVRASAKLPKLDDREFAKLNAARDQEIFEAVFASERARFSHAWQTKTSWFAGMANYSRARKQVREELLMGQHIDSVLRELGYKLVEDRWIVEEGRKTFLNDEDLDRSFLVDLRKTLGHYGWKKHKTRLRCFSNDQTGELIEVEPGGADTSGHFLHLLKSE